MVVRQAASSAPPSRDCACDFLFTLCHDLPAPLPLGRAVDHLHDHRVLLHQDRRPVHDRSSMMPQKRNPDMLELIRGRCGNVYGDLFALMTILKGLPIGYNRDLQEDKRIVFRAYDTVSSCLTMAAAIVNSRQLRQGEHRADAGPRLPRCDVARRIPRHQGRSVPHRPPHRRHAGRAVREGREDRAGAAHARRLQRSRSKPTDRRSVGIDRGRLQRAGRAERRQALPERRRRGRKTVRGTARGVEAAAGFVMSRSSTSRGLKHITRIPGRPLRRRIAHSPQSSPNPRTATTATPHTPPRRNHRSLTAASSAGALMFYLRSSGA